MLRILQWLAGPALAVGLWALPLPLESEAHRLAGLMAWTIAWWMMEPIPLPATALLAPALAIVLGIADPATVFAAFADPVIFLFLGGFLLARAMEVHGADRRLALAILNHRWVRGRPWRTIVAIVCATAFLSMWVSNTATAVIMIPIALGVVGRIFNSDDAKASQAPVVLAVAYAASIGGLATPVGTPPNAIAVAMLSRLAGVRVGFAEWMAVGVPIAVILLAILLWQVRRALPSLPKRSDPSPLVEEALRQGPVTRAQLLTLLCGSLAIAFWLMPDIAALLMGKEAEAAKWLKTHFPESVTALLAASLLFMLPAGDGSRVLSWKQAVRIDWGTLLLFGGGLSLGTLVFKTGLGAVIGELLPASPAGGAITLAFLAVTVTLCLVLTEVASNTATANMLLPMVIAASGAASGAATAAASSGAVAPALAVAMACSLGFMFPIGTPPNAIAYGTGLVPMRTMMKMGWLLDVLSALVLVGVFWLVSRTQ